MKRSVKRAVMASVFCAIGALIFMVVQNVLTPRDTWPYDRGKTADMIAELKDLRESDIQAFFVGPSHTAFSVDPMRIYKQSGITTYNLSSDGQRFPASYYVLKEAFQDQTSQYVFLDVSGFFTDDSEESFLISGVGWQSPNATFRNIFDSMKFNRNKMEFSEMYSGYFPKEQKLSAYIGGLLPIWQYHDRWKELGIYDFELFPADRNYFLKGYYLDTVSNAAWMDVSWMNYIAERNSTVDSVKWKRQIEDGVVSTTSDSDILYAPEIGQDRLSWVLRIKELCEKNGAALWLIKIPSCLAPQEQDSAWTKIKSDLVRGVASDLGIPFVDLLYDMNIGIDWSTDTEDSGKHLNYFGAKKVSDFFADYLQTECGLAGQYDENYENDIPAYEAACKAAELKMTRDLSSFLEQLSDFDDVTVFISAADMEFSLSDENYQELRNFGLETDFDSTTYIDSYLAVKEADTVCYEASSNRHLSKSDVLSNGSTYTVTSCGWDKGLESKIIIDGVDYSLNRQGINVVVYDNTSKQVLDSVLFPVNNTGSPSAVRDQSWNMRYSPLGCYTKQAYQLNYELYLMENTARNGVGR